MEEPTRDKPFDYQNFKHITIQKYYNYERRSILWNVTFRENNNYGWNPRIGVYLPHQDDPRYTLISPSDSTNSYSPDTPSSIDAWKKDPGLITKATVESYDKTNSKFPIICGIK
ncbi:MULTISPECIES: hypothetical protein [unclassified Streptococcus]|uniref:hypothetical protein n=1 Tax=unclassified Streptococcus TaxID=2608887 RepID=UPI000AAFA96B|nr:MULTISPECIES: hypothetical protein [unclassified Streptococcus]